MNCDACKAEIAVGSRWCGVCHAFARNPDVGTLAPPIKRLAAVLADLLMPVIALLAAVFSGGAGAGVSSAVVEQNTAFGIGNFFAAIVIVAYGVYAVLLFARGQTPGKKLVGIQVIAQDGEPAGFFTMLVREWVGKWISGFVFGLGYIWILIDPERQAWHDKLMTTYVIEPTT